MDNSNFLYLIKIIEDNNIQIVTEIDEIDGVVYSDGKVCAVLKRYTPPIDMSLVFSDLQKYKIPQIPIQQTQARTGKIILDHLGNQYGSIFQMCSNYGISETVYRSRVKSGWTVEEALTGKRYKVFDHLGNAYKSKGDMCQHYGIPYARFAARLKAGFSLEEALSNSTEKSETTVEDHLGNKFKNKSQMCQHYGIRMDTYCQRERRGWSLEEILTGKKPREAFDHKGNRYACLEDMCQAYELSPSLYKSRITRGWTVEEALLGVKDTSIAKDHLGNVFSSVKDMCDSYGIKFGTFRKRLTQGWSLEQALTIDTSYNPQKRKRAAIIDHLGNKYDSIAQMCEAYGISRSTFINRSNAGFSLEQALTGKNENVSLPTPVVHATKKGKVLDHLGNEYESLKAMCNAYGIRVDTYKFRRKQGYSLEKALTRIPSMSTTGIPCEDHLGNHYSSGAEMARAYGLTKSQFVARKRMGWSIEKILTTPMNTHTAGQPFVYGGKSYRSLKEFCVANGVRYDTFHHRLKRGYSIEEALNPQLHHKDGKTIREKKEAIDHKGEHFHTTEEMCAHYGIKVGTYQYRLRQGWTLEDALTIPNNKKRKKQEKKIPVPKYYDNNGVGFSSVKAMCDYHKISVYTYKKLHDKGLSLEEILEYQPEKTTFHFKDHLGNEYKSLKEMCSAWSVSVHTYQKRISNGYSIEQALTEPDNESKIYDHKGNAYPTILAMCRAYGISVSMYNARMKRGKTLKDALETPKEDNSIEYNNVRYNTVKELAKAYGINAGTFRSRLKMGWTVEEAISGVKHSREYYDHLGKAYPSQKEMCKAYGIKPSVYQGRISQGWTIEQALLGQPPEKEKKPRRRYDHLGNEYPDLDTMCKTYGINVATYQRRKMKGLSIEEILTSNEPIIRILDHKGNEYSTIKEMCEAYNVSTTMYYRGLKEGKDLAVILEGKT